MIVRSACLEGQPKPGACREERERVLHEAPRIEKLQASRPLRKRWTP